MPTMQDDVVSIMEPLQTSEKGLSWKGDFGSFEEPREMLGHSDGMDIKELHRLYWIHDIMSQGHAFLRRRNARWILGGRCLDAAFTLHAVTFPFKVIKKNLLCVKSRGSNFKR